MSSTDAEILHIAARVDALMGALSANVEALRAMLSDVPPEADERLVPG